MSAPLNKEEATTNTGSVQSSREAQTLARVIEALEELEPSARKRILQTASVFYGSDPSLNNAGSSPVTSHARVQSSESLNLAPFTEDRTPSPKEFLLSKRPSTDIERVACLAYYLTHFRGTTHFKTLDISKLNTEAAQAKLSNTAYSVENATKAGLLVQSTRGNKIVSAAGEMYVQALPDKAAAKSAFNNFRPSKKKGRKIDQHSGND